MGVRRKTDVKEKQAYNFVTCFEVCIDIYHLLIMTNTHIYFNQHMRAMNQNVVTKLVNST